jgi:hypothetical protein
VRTAGNALRNDLLSFAALRAPHGFKRKIRVQGYTSGMRDPLLRLAVSLLVTAFPAVAQTPSSEAHSIPQASSVTPSSTGDEALAWDRDFDLLLELKNEPTRAQREMDVRRAGLVKERGELAARIDALRARLAAVEGTYTTETILNEMLRQGVADMQTAQENLRIWIRQDEDRVKEIDAKLQRLTAEANP